MASGSSLRSHFPLLEKTDIAQIAWVPRLPPTGAMLDRIRNWRVRRIVARRPIAEPLWQDALRRCAPARRLGASDQAALRVLATLFLQNKSLEPVQGLELDDADRVLLAAHACVPILKL